MRIVEVCAGDIQSARAAAQGGAQRIELCAALELDGLTPSAGLIKAARALTNMKLHVLIRPREGNFVYDAHEIEIMRNDILLAKRLGADGVVIGALTNDGDIDVKTCRTLMRAATGMQVTFHRAFDQCNNPQKALEEIIALGCNRILTSGQQATADAGIPLLKQLVEQAKGRIIIMPGAGVNAGNAWHILHETGATEIHGSFRSQQKGRMITDASIVKEVVESINDMN